MKIKTLKKDIETTNAIRRFRNKTGSAQRADNHFKWWVAVFVVLASYKGNNLTCHEIQVELEEEVGLYYPNLHTCGSLLKNAADGILPDPKYREYAQSLPGLAHLLGLNYIYCQDSELSNGRGRPALSFSFENKNAKKYILFEFPETEALFDLL